ncbi:MAG: ferrous iron transport protein B [Elusimicrobiota bacterium]
MNKKLLLAGNPNVGKSVIFNRLTGKYVTVSNYPGTTVDISSGKGTFAGDEFTVVDTPGTDSLIPASEDERVTRDVIFSEKPDCIIQVADAKNVRRTITFAIELSDLGIPLVIDLNMADEADERGIKIDIQKLSSLFASSVVRTVAITGDGIGKLKDVVAAHQPAPAHPPGPGYSTEYSLDIEQGISKIIPLLPADFPYKKSLAIMLLAGDESSYKFAGENHISAIKDIVSAIAKRYHKPLGRIIIDERQRLADSIIKEITKYSILKTRGWEESIGNALLKPFPGIPAAIISLFIMYEFVGVFGAGTCVDFLEDVLFGKLVNPFIVSTIKVFKLPQLLNDLLIGEYGLITMALTYALAIIFPIVTTFFIFFGVMEDTGYLPRLSVILDKVFRLIGLNGKAVLPMILGLGCGTMATLTTRILESKKERMMVTFLLALGVPCSAQLGVIIAMLEKISVRYTLIWLAIIVSNLLVSGWLIDKVVKGKRVPFLMEVPPLRIPQLGNILMKVRIRTVWYLREAVPLFILGTFLLFISDKLGILKAAENILSPVIYNLLGLPVESAFAFIIGFLRRDYGAAGFFTLQKAGMLSASQVLVATVVITLFIPCIAQFFMMVKERGSRTALMITLFIVAYAVGVGAFLNVVIKILKG